MNSDPSSTMSEGMANVKKPQNSNPKPKPKPKPKPIKIEGGLVPAESLSKSATITSTGKSQNRVQVPKFLVKTFDILEDGSYSQYVSWNGAGDALVVKQVHGFTEVVLPTFFKHSNFASFVRQLNMYGFHRTDDKEITFRQDNFRRGKKEKLALIKRKVTSKQAAHINHEKEIKSLLLEVKRLKSSQEKYDKQMLSLQQVNSSLERENNAMWDALNRAKERQDLLASKMQKIMLFLYKAYRGPQKKIRYGDPVPKLTDASAITGGRGTYNEGQALERANSLIQGLESSDRLLKSIDPTHGNMGVPSPIGTNVVGDSSSSAWISPRSGGPRIQEVVEPTQAQPTIIEPQNTRSADDIGMTADSLMALDTNTLEPLLRSQQQLQDVGTVLKNEAEEDKRNQYLGITKDMDRHLMDQDNTLQRLNTVESMLDDPLDNFLDYTSRDQINSILDIAGDDALAEDTSSPKRKVEADLDASNAQTKRRKQN